VSRINSGEIELALEDIDITDVVRDVVSSMERELTAAQSELHVRVEERVIGRWDRLRLEQIITNLVSNAIRYGLGNPIEISVEGRGSSAILSVRDRGLGIPREEQEIIFQRLERGASVRQTGGFGIGLWVVRKLCAALGGNVEVVSTPGEGSTFTVTLPRDHRRST
jgi:signal transduction histidine kinase